MSRQIVKQPNGRFYIYSSTVDDVIVYDATKQELIDYLCEEETQKITSRVNMVTSMLDKGG